MFHDDVEAETGVLYRAGQHVAEEGIQQQRSGDDDQRPSGGAPGDFEYKKNGDAAEELVPCRHFVDVAHAVGDFRKVHGEVYRRGYGQGGAAYVNEDGEPAFLFALGQFSARHIEENERGDEGHIGHAHHGAVQHAESGGEPDLEQRQRKAEQPGDGFYSLPG